MQDLDLEIYDSNNLRLVLKEHKNNMKTAIYENESRLRQIAVKLKEFDKIIISGCGDKYIVPQLTQFLTDNFSKKNIRIIHSRKLANYLPEWLDEKTFVIFLTASGKTVDVIDAMKKVVKKNCEMLVITQLERKIKNSVYEVIKDYNKCEFIIPVKKAEVTWPSTTSFHTFSTILNSLFIFMIELEGSPVSALLNIQMLDLPDYVDNLVNDKNMHSWCIKIAKELINNEVECFYFMGDGPRFVAAKKGAYVHFVESCKQDSIAFESEDFTHLVIETLSEENKKKNVLILLKPRESYVSRQAFNQFQEINQIWSSKSKVIIIDPFKYVTPKGIGTKNDILLTPLYVVMLEWLAYYYAILNKQDPSKKNF